MYFQHESTEYSGGKFCFEPLVNIIPVSSDLYYAFDNQGSYIGTFVVSSENGIEDYAGDSQSEYGVFYFVTSSGECMRGDLSTGTANDYTNPVIFE